LFHEVPVVRDDGLVHREVVFTKPINFRGVAFGKIRHPRTRRRRRRRRHR